MTQTAAHIRAVNKYNAKNYEQLKISVKKGFKDKVKQAAEEAGESMTGYIVKATEKRMETTKNAIRLKEAKPCPICGNPYIILEPIQNMIHHCTDWKCGCNACGSFVLCGDRQQAIDSWKKKTD